MIGTIEQIINNQIEVKLALDVKKTTNLINLYVLIKDTNKSFIGEITELSLTKCKVNILGKLENNDFIYGFDEKPSFASVIYLLNYDFVKNIVGFKNNYLIMGKSPFYENAYINADINSLFGSHFAIFGSSGSGKSCGFTRIMQNLMKSENMNDKPNIIIFDAYGEYAKAFNYLNNEPTFAYKTYNTDLNSNDEILLLPPWLLGVDEYALLLEANDKSQLSLIEKTLRYVNLFIKDDETVKAYKNTILAKALLDILISGKPGPQIRDQVIGVLTKTHTDEINLESEISEPGYYRTFRQCMRVDDHNKINAIEQVTDFLQKFIGDEVTFSLPDGTFPFTLQDVSNALEFALIDEGVWKNDSVFNMMNILKVRLDSILNSDNKKYFEYPQYISLDSYIDRILHTQNGKKAQIVNFNINYVTERLGKSLVKIYSKLIFNYVTSLKERGSEPFNIIIEEAHRYVQNDIDSDVLGYNIFERIAKEGRKYGVTLLLASQRPSELSETIFSQCNNFIAMRLTNPNDQGYVKKLLPDTLGNLIDKMPNLKTGEALLIGDSIALPSIVQIDKCEDNPSSNDIPYLELWKKEWKELDIDKIKREWCNH